MALMEAPEAVAREKRLRCWCLIPRPVAARRRFIRERAGKGGEIPRYALMPNGDMTATSMFYKFL